MEGAREFPPHFCLVLHDFRGGRLDFESTRVAAGPHRVRLETSSGETKRMLELVREDSWKIDLLSTVELNRKTRP